MIDQWAPGGGAGEPPGVLRTHIRTLLLLTHCMLLLRLHAFFLFIFIY